MFFGGFGFACLWWCCWSNPVVFWGCNRPWFECQEMIKVVCARVVEFCSGEKLIKAWVVRVFIDNRARSLGPVVP